MYEGNWALLPRRKFFPAKLWASGAQEFFSLATNLYSKDTRFVFELIQNAEDNDYTTVEAARDEPLLTFGRTTS